MKKKLQMQTQNYKIFIIKMTRLKYLTLDKDNKAEIVEEFI